MHSQTYSDTQPPATFSQTGSSSTEYNMRVTFGGSITEVTPTTNYYANGVLQETVTDVAYGDETNGMTVSGNEVTLPASKSTTLTNTSDFSLFTTDETNDSVTRNNSGSYDSSWAYQSSSITASADYEYYVNDVLVWTSTDFNSGTLYPSIATDMNSVGAVSYTHLRAHETDSLSRMPSSA